MKLAHDVLAGKAESPKDAKDAKPAKKGKGKLREMSIRHGHAGGFIAKHHVDYEDGGADTHEYPLLNKKQLLEHIEEHAQEAGADEAAAAPEPAAGE